MGRRAFTAVLLIALVSTIVRAYLAFRYYGFQTGDDLEIAEEAFRVAAGLVHTPWDIRSLLIPDVLVAPFVYLAHALGMHDPLTLAAIARVPFLALSALNIVLVYLLGRRWYGERAGVIASALYAVHWIPLVYGSSLFPRTLSVTCVLAALLVLRRSPLLAGALAGLAVASRYSEAVSFIALLFFAFGEEPSQRRRTLPALTAGFALMFAFLGWYDRLTWGRWFGSFLEFAELTLVRSDASAGEPVQPLWWYLTNLPHWIPVTLLPPLIVAVRRTELRKFVAFVAIPILALSAIAHKESRYLQVILPFVLLLGAHGFTLWWSQPNRRRLAVVCLALAFPLSLTRIGQASKRSTNAVAAATWMSSRDPQTVALSQAWAYGGRLFLGNDPAITDIGLPPDLTHLRRLAPTLSVLGVYTNDVDDALRTVCRSGGLTQTITFRDRGGRSVTVFHRNEPLR